MAVTTLTPAEFHERHRRGEHTALTTELLLAPGTVVLSILGLVRVFPTYLAAIATIGLGVMLLFESASVVFRSYELLSEAGAADKVDASEVSRAVTAELLAGVVGLVLGILALGGMVPLTLMAVAVITYGGMLVLTSGESMKTKWCAAWCAP
jgi:hypothetical protein